MAIQDKSIELFREENAKRKKRGLPVLGSRRNTVKRRSPRKKAGGREYLVQGAAGFSAVIDDAISCRHDGNRNAAAVDADLPYSTLKRFHEGRGNAIRHQSLEKLLKLVGAGRAPALEAALISPIAREALSVYDGWVAKEIRALGFGSVGSARLNAARWEIEREAQVSAFYDRATRLTELLHRMLKKFPNAWKPLTSRLVERGHFAARARLAQLRVVAPLLDHEETWEIERAPWEISPREIEQFIRCGATREAILLDRETDIRRAQENTRRVAKKEYRASGKAKIKTL